MTMILISTTGRNTPVDLPSGRLILFDWDKKRVDKVCKIIEPPYRVENPNPRGGLRGSKGISIHNDKIAISNASTVFIYDKNWTPTNIVYHPSCASIHDIVLKSNSVWVTSARNDLLLELSLDSKIIKYYDGRKFLHAAQHNLSDPNVFLSEDQILLGKFDFRDPGEHDKVATDSRHVNSLAIDKNGDIYLSGGFVKTEKHDLLLYIKNWLIITLILEVIEKINMIIKKIAFWRKNYHFSELVIQPIKGKSIHFRIKNNGFVEKLFTFDKVTAPSHSVRLLHNGKVIWLKTSTGELTLFEKDKKNGMSFLKIGQNFIRGAVELDDGTLLIGDQNRIIHFDLDAKTVIGEYSISDNVMEAVFDIVVLPNDFGAPPDSFYQLHSGKYSIDQEPKFITPKN